jgi:hypothetical protein
MCTRCICEVKDVTKSKAGGKDKLCNTLVGIGREIFNHLEHKHGLERQHRNKSKYIE